jgi:hypothetical protein
MVNSCVSSCISSPDRVVEIAAALQNTVPNDAATVAAKLTASLASARAHDADCTAADRRPSGYIPFSLQRKVCGVYVCDGTVGVNVRFCCSGATVIGIYLWSLTSGD